MIKQSRSDSRDDLNKVTSEDQPLPKKTPNKLLNLLIKIIFILASISVLLLFLAINIFIFDNSLSQNFDPTTVYTTVYAFAIFFGVLSCVTIGICTYHKNNRIGWLSITVNFVVISSILFLVALPLGLSELNATENLSKNITDHITESNKRIIDEINKTYSKIESQCVVEKYICLNNSAAP